MLFYTSEGKLLCDERGPSASQKKTVFLISLLKRSQAFLFFFFFFVDAFTACTHSKTALGLFFGCDLKRQMC